MDYEDRITVATPEGVSVDIALAGLGSRLVAALADLVIQGVILIAITASAFFVGASVVSPGWAIGVALPLFFLVLVGYPVLFETLDGGRTPGKRSAGIRVVSAGGHPVSVGASLVRNVVRLIDGPPFFYAIGIVLILATPKNQRLGDLAAGTLVVRDRHVPPPADDIGAVAAQVYAGWDTSGLAADEVALVRRFVERRASLAPAARSRLAADLAGRLRERVVGTHHTLGDEEFLLAVLAARAAAGR